MGAYEVTVDTLREQYVYVVDAADERHAELLGVDAATVDGLNPAGRYWTSVRPA